VCFPNLPSIGVSGLDESFIVMVHRTSADAASAKAILASSNAPRVDGHNTIAETSAEAAAA